MNENGFNVIHVIPPFFRTGDGVIGGAERYAFELARNMANIVPTTLVSFGEKDSEDSFGALKVKLLGDAHYVRRQRTNPMAIPYSVKCSEHRSCIVISST